ncbi:NAD(P)/FAD-dependent oxidoreductase, partial [Lactobacillus paragasseri]|nr:NAD(P)/FAD-dependent oxidoreductase [Lactobacillus paragasseri]
LSMANYAAKDIQSRVNQQARPAKYEYHDLGVVVAIGETQAAGKALGVGSKGYLASALKKIIIDKSLMETGGLKETFSVGRFDLYH